MDFAPDISASLAVSPLAVMALPGFAWHTGMESCWSQLPEHGGHRTTFAAGAGTPHTDSWFRPEKGRWQCDGPNLEHAGTVGTLIGWLPPQYQITRKGAVFAVVVFNCTSLTGIPVLPRAENAWAVVGDTLGHTVAQALLAVGRCG